MLGSVFAVLCNVHFFFWSACSGYNWLYNLLGWNNLEAISELQEKKTNPGVNIMQHFSGVGKKHPSALKASGGLGDR